MLLVPVLMVCSAIISVSSLYFNPHGHAFIVLLTLLTAAARFGSVTFLHFAKRSTKQHVTLNGRDDGHFVLHCVNRMYARTQHASSRIASVLPKQEPQS